MNLPLIELRARRLACRSLRPSEADAHTILAEAGALCAASCGGAPHEVWMLPGDDTVEVAVVISADARIPEGMHEMRIAAGTYAVASIAHADLAHAQRFRAIARAALDQSTAAAFASLDAQGITRVHVGPLDHDVDLSGSRTPRSPQPRTPGSAQSP
ncbi:MAG: GyrI-like domain-containing protein [Planctomycetota bacterium]